ncbi:hypothetical protein H4R33_005043 [Dimargaris cristalligena]|uniref:Delta-12 desaturase n=1 Tax=Dimargaris cristalligena TaxID=215637 RepID=A0A4V1J4C3_9FUNG|nr:hypothetical protein H4R33_005043 [Dimargaris cristalligena]RKP35059.1 delta-12 desaturase [Dimargaris cristalligena]|eukprot:RKP35059.1 delta-12 desaturase [Dimargaris cristalligena]
MGEKIEYLTPSTDLESTFQPPNIGIKELRDAVPAHCFERSALRSSVYVAHDFALVALFVYLASFIDTVLPPSLRLLAWPLYWVAQGIVCTGIWVIGHECGHQSYSSSKSINNAVGWVLHSALLVPFYSWRYSHSNHHKATNHMQRDEVFVPKTRQQREVAPTASVIPSILAASDDAPLMTLYNVVGMTIAGWPLYLFTNVSGPKYAEGTNHFDPNSVLFKPHQYNNILLSDLGVLLTLSALGYASYIFSFLTVVKFYVIPYFMVNFWLVTITFLQHTHPSVPHYRPKEWTFVRGALSTVDRSFGPLLNYCLHNITDTHVAHHLFSTIPHYHAMEATQAIQKVLGSYYYNDQTNWAKALWDTNAHCRFVEDEGEILFWRRSA